MSSDDTTAPDIESNNSQLYTCFIFYSIIYGYKMLHLLSYLLLIYRPECISLLDAFVTLWTACNVVGYTF